MYPSLNPGAIGVHVDSLPAGLELAARHGFAGFHFSIAEAATLGAEAVAEAAARTQVRLSAWGFPVEFRQDQARWEQGLAQLPGWAALAARLGATRTATWIMPGSDERTYDENFRFHVERLRPAAAILADHGVRLGLEYVGPLTSRAGSKYPFAHTMDQMLELCAAVGPNVGLLLDSWHWYTAHEAVRHLRRLAPAQVVDVHLNDAPAGLAADEQLDLVRELPCATGVIDIAGFLGSLAAIGYDGPAMVEPFSEALRQLPAEQAVARTADALRLAWTRAGL